MDKNSEIIALVSSLEKNRPKNLMACLDVVKEGIRRTMIYLYETGYPVSAGDISRNLNISTARASVLLRKMERKGYITRMRDVRDCRKVRISLTQQGLKSVEMNREKFLGQVVKAVNKVGLERFRLFVEISKEIKDAFDEIIAEEDGPVE